MKPAFSQFPSITRGGFHLLAAVIAGLHAMPSVIAEPSPLSAVPLPLRIFEEDRTNRPMSLILASTPDSKKSERSLRKTMDMVTAFTSPPVSTSGFSHVVVPFDVDDRNNRESVDEANAFSLLLHSALRWNDGCYQTLDLLPFCRSNSDLLRLITRTLNRDGIKRIAIDAHATHVLTGTLKRDNKKYTAEVVIFNAGSQAVFKKNYKEPMGFFELLGRMTEDISEHFGQPITASTKAHIEKQRCQFRRSLVELGGLVFENDRHAELGVFTAILQREPTFAEARIWAASRGHLVRGDQAGYSRHVRQAFSDYMTPEALDAFLTTDPTAIRPALLNEDIVKLEELLGSAHPMVLTARIQTTNSISPEFLVRAIQAAGTHPCHPYLLESLYTYVTTPGSQTLDADLAAELAWTSLQCRTDFPGTNGAYRLTHNLANALLDAGHTDLAIRVFDSIFSEVNGKNGFVPTLVDIHLYYTALRQARRYEDAFNAAMFGVSISQNQKSPLQHQFIVNAGFATAIAGDPEMVGEVTSKYEASLSGSPNELHLLKGYLALLGDGHAKDYTLLPENVPAPLFREETLFLAQRDLLGKKIEHRARLDNLLHSHPMDRELWVLFDAYDRAETSTNSVYFYESLNWLCGSDPWVVRAVSDYRDRTDNMKLASMDSAQWDAIVSLGSQMPLPPPQTLAASIQTLLLKKKFEEAELRIQKYMLRFSRSGTDSAGSETNVDHWLYCQHILRLVQSRVLFPGS